MTPARIRLAIIEDEAPARRRIRRLLQKMEDIEIIGEAEDGRTGLELIERDQPDVIILDINMPEFDGIRMLEALDDPPAVIFSTACEEHAIRAFDLSAVDYLLKPYSAERLNRALDRVRRQFPSAPASAHEPDSHRIPAECGRGIEFLEPTRVSAACIEAGVVFLLQTNGEKPCFAGTLQDLEELLPPQDFLRASRQAVVNSAAVERMTPTDEGGFKLVLKGGHEVIVSRRRARHFRAIG